MRVVSRVFVAMALLLVLAAPGGHGTDEGRLPAISVTQLPLPAGATNLMFTVYDSAVGGCDVGGGSMVVDCVSNGVAWIALPRGGSEFLLWQGRMSDTIAAPQCAALARGPSTAAGAITFDACNDPLTNFYATHNMVITRLAVALQGAPASGDGCDIQLQIAGVAQGTDANNWLDLGSSSLDAIGEMQSLPQNFAVSAGQRIEVAAVDAGATQCIAGTGCDCVGPTGAQAFNLFVYGRSR